MSIAFTEGPLKAFALTQGHAGEDPPFLPTRKLCRRSASRSTVQTALAESPFLWAGFTVAGAFKRRLILEGLACCIKSTASCCVILVSLIQLPAINFSETELPGSRLAISDKLACYYFSN